jgi:hypothetical protein
MKTSTNMTPGAVNRQVVADTFPGQAHWAGSGPPDCTCRQCIHWGDGCGGYWARGSLKPQRCAKYRLFAMAVGPAVPHHAQACQHFEKNPKAPPVFDTGN